MTLYRRADETAPVCLGTGTAIGLSPDSRWVVNHTVGLLYGNVILARDGQHHVYRLRRVLSELHVAEGLK